MREGKRQTANGDSITEPLTEYQLKRRITWAALIKCVYEVDPLECPKCGEDMIILRNSFLSIFYTLCVDENSFLY